MWSGGLSTRRRPAHLADHRPTRRAQPAPPPTPNMQPRRGIALLPQRQVPAARAGRRPAIRARHIKPRATVAHHEYRSNWPRRPRFISGVPSGHREMLVHPWCTLRPSPQPSTEARERPQKLLFCRILPLVGAPGFEPGTSCSQSKSPAAQPTVVSANLARARSSSVTAVSVAQRLQFLRLTSLPRTRAWLLAAPFRRSARESFADLGGRKGCSALARSSALLIRHGCRMDRWRQCSRRSPRDSRRRTR